MKRDAIDFTTVPQHQRDMDARLENWAIWCHGSTRAQIHPMWRYYRSQEVWHMPEARMSVDIRDAIQVEKGVVALPERHRHAIQWHYVIRCTPGKAARKIGVTPRDLQGLVVDGRQMLLNRGI